MYTEIFQQLGLSKNEAEIYEALIRENELSVGEIAVKSKVHRRNVYDALNRLLDKGLVFEIIEKRESRYQAVDPNKLREIIQEKETLLMSILPELDTLFSAQSKQNDVYVYRGIEGWKNYMRDIIRLGEDFYCVGAKGAWMEEEAMNYFPTFIKDAKRAGIKYHHLFDYEVKEKNHEILKYVGKNYKFFPKKYQTAASLEIFGDRVNISSNLTLGAIGKDISITVIVDEDIANSFRTWFKFMWDSLPKK